MQRLLQAALPGVCAANLWGSTGDSDANAGLPRHTWRLSGFAHDPHPGAQKLQAWLTGVRLQLRATIAPLAGHVDAHLHADGSGSSGEAAQAGAAAQSCSLCRWSCERRAQRPGAVQGLQGLPARCLTLPHSCSLLGAASLCSAERSVDSSGWLSRILAPAAAGCPALAPEQAGVRRSCSADPGGAQPLTLGWRRLWTLFQCWC